ncbi:sensor histidine kinase [Flavobacterium silvaticum]|uniref:histidine kinase n=1 Tax=Flavobacterium silvaticum TaxID=1852020 RepID=A0A972FZJ0_9FLAO|nr:histidine kinase [Flavobacterium silvaticum]NMH27666.1 hypothetical protein [Flavobacterium silvaticum]
MKRIVLLLSLVLIFGCDTTQSFDEVVNHFKNYDKSHDVRQLLVIEQKLRFTNNDSVKCHFYFKLANRYWNSYNLSQYKRVCDSLNHFLENKQTSQQGKLQLYYAEYFDAFGGQKSFRNINRAIKIFSKNDDYRNLVKALNVKANFLYSKGDYLGAEITGLNALKVVEDNKEYDFGDQQTIIYNLLGMVSREMKNYKESKLYHLKAYTRYLKESKVSKLIVPKEIIRYNIALIEFDKQNFKRATRDLFAILNNQNISKEHEVFYANVLDAAGYSKFKATGLLDDKLMLEALKINEKHNIRDRVILNKIHLSEIYYKENKVDKALKFAKEASQMAQTNNLMEELVMANKRIVMMEMSRENFIRYTDATEKIHTQLLKNREKYYRMDYELDNVLLDLKSTKKEKVRWILLLLLGISILFLLLIIINQKFQNSKIKTKQRELSANQNFYKLFLKQKQSYELSIQSSRMKIARELHDGIMNKLSSIRLNIHGILNSTYSKEDFESYLSDLKQLEFSIRNISHNISHEIEIENFVPMIRNLIKDFKNHNKGRTVTFHLDSEIDWIKIDLDIKKNLYRIFQESLNNIQKHSNADKIFIGIEKKKIIIIDILDNGSSFKKNFNLGNGIKNIKSRVSEMNGRLTISKKEGFKIHIEI